MVDAPIVHHPAVPAVLADRYRPADVARIADLLRSFGATDLRAADNGLYPAVGRIQSGNAYTGYQRTWVRDTVHVVNSAWEAGQTGSVKRTAATLTRWFESQRGRFEAILEGSVDKHDELQRPHVRFDGERLAELPERWPHKQKNPLPLTDAGFHRVRRGHAA